jgi:hypothetical protein
MTTDEALDLALEALERLDGWLALRYGSGLTPQEQQVVTAIKQALAAPVQEPVAWMQPDEVHISLWKDDYHTIPLYTTPPAAQRQWVGLTLTDREKLRDQFEGWSYPAILVDAVADILKEKNI